ncbi:katanin p80 WD40 repeat-containing subunit B1-like [Ptychodera flava]|uniref:katanin p80 WD40 repeat-containing subunit B1-like n=1 Tax=Ptychodera flava TaxID=63121 RepID=UPI00396AA832
MPRPDSRRRDKRGILDAGAGFMLWNSRRQKWEWVDKSRLLKIKKEKGKRHPIQPSPYAEYIPQSPKKRQNPSFKVPGKKACVQPLKSYNRKSPHKRLMKPAQCNETEHGDQFTPESYSEQTDTTDSDDKMEGRIIVHKPSDVPVTDIDRGAGSNKMLDELISGHDTMMKIMSTRRLELRAAETFWHRSPSALVTYILRTNDDAITVDLLPFLTKSITDKAWNGLTLSMGACFDLLPTLRRLLSSQFEDYIVAALDMLRTIIKHWWKQFKTMNQPMAQMNPSDFLRSQSVSGIFTVIVSMTDDIKELSKRPGNLGKKAHVVYTLLSQL